MNIAEAGSYILGQRYLEELETEPVRLTEDIIKLGKELLETFPTAKAQIKRHEIASVFYKLTPDFAREVPKEMREELFYTLKLGYGSPVVPAKALFILSRAKEACHTLNLIPRVVPQQDLKTMFSKGYIAEGYTLRDVICDTIDPSYVPIQSTNLAVRNGDYWDIYIAATDMVATVPTKIKESLTASDISSLEVVNRNICLAGHPINQLGGYIGVSNSTYDLRHLI